MSETIDPTPDVEQSPFPATGNLRDLLRHRVEGKIRRIHKQWFCLDPTVQAELDEARAEFAEKFALEAVKAGDQAQSQPARKYSAQTGLQVLAQRVDELYARSREVGVMGVFANLTDAQIEAALQTKADTADSQGFARAKAVLLAAFQRWETADGAPIPASEFGVEDLDALLQPEVVERGEFLPLAQRIIEQSSSVIDRPTSQLR